MSLLPRPGVLVRWIIAATIAGAGIFGLVRVMNVESDWLVVFAKSLFGVAGLMTGVLLVSPEVVQWAVSPIHALLDAILMPNESEPPPVDFKLARYYVSKLRFADACEEYQKIIHFHPEQKDAYLEGIQAAGYAGDEEAAKRLWKRGKRWLRSPEEKALLANVYAARREPPPLPAEDEEDPDALPAPVSQP